MRIVIFGNGPSLKRETIQETNQYIKSIADQYDVTIACNYFYKSGVIPHYYCLHDVNFFNHCPIPPKEFFRIPTTFVITTLLLQIHKDILQEIKPKMIIINPLDHNLVNKLKFAKFPDIYLTSGTITNETIPLARELINRCPNSNRQIDLYGVDR